MKPININSLKSEFLNLTINKKTYQVRFIPMGYLIKITKIQESEKTWEKILVECMEVIYEIVKIDNPKFEKKDLDTLDIEKASELINWIVSFSKTENMIEYTEEKKVDYKDKDRNKKKEKHRKFRKDKQAENMEFMITQFLIEYKGAFSFETVISMDSRLFFTYYNTLGAFMITKNGGIVKGLHEDRPHSPKRKDINKIKNGNNNR